MKYLAGLIILAIIAVAGVVLATRDNNQNTNNNGSNQTATPSPQSSNNNTTGEQPSTADKVSISNFAFTPASITVKKGTTVTWTNNDSVAHTVTADSGNGPNSELLQNGETYSFTFNEAGTFKYHCVPHPSMKATVTVTE